MRANYSHIVVFTLLSSTFMIVTSEQNLAADIPEREGQTSRVHALTRSLLEERDYEKLRLIRMQMAEAPAEMRKELILSLLRRLQSTKPIGLENFSDVQVESRIASGKMQFLGHGVLIKQDIFIEGGRCAWAIERILDVKLPPIREGMHVQDLARAFEEASYLIIESMEIASTERPATRAVQE